MGIILQLSAETLTELFAMMQHDQGSQRQYVSVYHMPDVDREKKAGQGGMWLDPVKVKHWGEHLDTDRHFVFSAVQVFGLVGLLSDSFRGSAQDLERAGHPNLTQPTIIVGRRGHSGGHSPSGPQPRWWVPANRPRNDEQGLPPEHKWRLLHILTDLFLVPDDLEDREPWLVERKDPPMDGLSMAAPQVNAYVPGCRRHEGGFHIPAG